MPKLIHHSIIHGSGYVLNGYATNIAKSGRPQEIPMRTILYLPMPNLGLPKNHIVIENHVCLGYRFLGTSIFESLVIWLVVGRPFIEV